MKIKGIKIGILAMATLALASCTKDDEKVNKGVIAPDTYLFERSGSSTVSFDGQSTRIEMAGEISKAFTNTANTKEAIASMFGHKAGESDFVNTLLNGSDKNVRSKIAASKDFYSGNTTEAAAIKADFDKFITDQVTDVFPRWDSIAVAGKAGQLQQAGGGSVRYVNEKGVELNQMFAKATLGGLMLDQIVNNYLSTTVLDEGESRSNNDKDILEEGKPYTAMEHKWDEAYGYLYGMEANPAVPVLKVDKFLNEYIAKVDEDADFAGIASTVFNAFKLGRAAIVQKNYVVRDAQINILRENLSKIPAVRAVYYLQSGKGKLSTDKASAFHSFSEGLGFIYSLQFTRIPGTNSPYFTKAEVDAYIATLLAGNGLWDAKDATLDTISDEISARFGFTTAQAVK